MTRRVLLDTDLAYGAAGDEPDDGLALAAIVGDPELDLELVTTVAGNAGLADVTARTAVLLRRLGAEVALVAGSNADEASANPAALAITDRARAEPGALTLMAIGPLTNVAAALRLEPRLPSLLADVIVMGGALAERSGRPNRPAEFNVWRDARAWDEVHRSFDALRVVGLDVTRRVRIARTRAAEWTACGDGFLAEAGPLLSAWIDERARRAPDDLDARTAAALHDATAVVALVRPDLFAWELRAVRVVLDAGTAHGVLQLEPSAATSLFATAVQADACLAHIEERLALVIPTPHL